MKILTKYIEKYGEEYLIFDGRIPILSNATVLEELRLYNIPSQKHHKIMDLFEKITDKQINSEHKTGELSGGQKTILSIIIALESAAPKILFINFFKSLHQNKKNIIMELIKEYEINKDHIKIIQE